MSPLPEHTSVHSTLHRQQLIAKSAGRTLGGHAVEAVADGERGAHILHLQQQLHPIHRRRGGAAHRPRYA